MTFLHQRIGTSPTVEVVPGQAYKVVYLSLPNMMQALEHQGAVIDYLKMDIENAEWNVFENSLYEVYIYTLYMHIYQIS